MLGEGIREKSLRYRVLITEDEDGQFVAECPSLPGCISQGATRELALENIQDAIRGYLESLKKHGDPIPPSISEEIVEVTV
jgi:predicted RNase H-like HicB family nuclease